MGADCKFRIPAIVPPFRGDRHGATKSAVTQMTRAMAEAWSGQGITANAIGPDFSQLN